jgi:hypothetical protein
MLVCGCGRGGDIPDLVLWLFGFNPTLDDLSGFVASGFEISKHFKSCHGSGSLA